LHTNSIAARPFVPCPLPRGTSSKRARFKCPHTIAHSPPSSQSKGAFQVGKAREDEGEALRLTRHSSLRLGALVTAPRGSSRRRQEQQRVIFQISPPEYLLINTPASFLPACCQSNACRRFFLARPTAQRTSGLGQPSSTTVPPPQSLSCFDRPAARPSTGPGAEKSLPVSDGNGLMIRTPPARFHSGASLALTTPQTHPLRDSIERLTPQA